MASEPPHGLGKLVCIRHSLIKVVTYIAFPSILYGAVWQVTQQELSPEVSKRRTLVTIGLQTLGTTRKACIHTDTHRRTHPAHGEHRVLRHGVGLPWLRMGHHPHRSPGTQRCRQWLQHKAAADVTSRPPRLQRNVNWRCPWRSLGRGEIQWLGGYH